MGVRIQELPETTGINKEDVLIVEDGQGTKKGTVQQLDETLGVSQLKEELVNDYYTNNYQFVVGGLSVTDGALEPNVTWAISTSNLISFKENKRSLLQQKR